MSTKIALLEEVKSEKRKRENGGGRREIGDREMETGERREETGINDWLRVIINP